MLVCSPVRLLLYANVHTYIDYRENMNIREFMTNMQTLDRVYRIMKISMR